MKKKYLWDKELVGNATWTLVDKYGQFAIQHYRLCRNKKGKIIGYWYEMT